MGWFDTILFPIKWAVAWILVTVHDGLVLLPWLEPGSGPAWVLSIVGLTLVIRTLIIPLFFKQIKAQRGMQLVQPEMQKLQKRYKGKTDPASKQKMQQEMMALYKEHGTNPFASCLPMLLQMPIFFALFRVLYSLEPLAAGTYPRESIGRLTATHAEEALTSTLFGAPISSTFLTAEGDETLVVRIVAAFLIVMMSATMFLSQRQLTMKNMPASALDNPFAKQQKLLMYIFPFIFMITGVYFPIGVLIYWTISNLWTMGQQFYTIRRHPSPGSEAYKARQQRINAKRARKGLPSLEEEEKAKSGSGKQVEAAPEKTSGQRQQPKRKDRAKKDVTKPGGATPAGVSGEVSAADSVDSAASAESAQSPGASGPESEVEAASPRAANGQLDAGQTSSPGKAPQGMTPAERAEWRYRQRMERIRQSKKN